MKLKAYNDRLYTCENNNRLTILNLQELTEQCGIAIEAIIEGDYECDECCFKEKYYSNGIYKGKKKK